MDRRHFIRMALMAPVVVKAAPILATLNPPLTVAALEPKLHPIYGNALTPEMLRRMLALMRKANDGISMVWVHPAQVERFREMGYWAV